MKQISLGKTGEQVSELCLGAMLMGTTMDTAKSFEILDHFVSIGGNFIDTANCYSWWVGKGEYIGDESENVLGLWMKERKNRDKVFIATKVGARLKDPYHIRDASGEPEWERVRREYEGLSKTVIKREVENSLKRLKTDYLDLYYTHVYDYNTPMEETLDALNELVKEGKVKNIGACNITAKQLSDAIKISTDNQFAAFSVIQEEYSYLHPLPGVDTGISVHGDDEILSYSESTGIAFLAYSPLLKGIYSNKEKRNQYYNWHLYRCEEAIKRLDLVESLSKKLGITGNQLVLAWLLKHQPKIIPILGFSRLEHYLEDVKAFEINLPEEVMEQLGQ